MPTGIALTEYRPNLRLLLVIFLAIAVSLPIALLSLAKVLVFLAALAYLLKNLVLARNPAHLTRLHSSHVVLISMLIWGASLFWTGASLEDGLIAFVKHGKLMLIPILLYLLQNRREAQWGVLAFLAGQSWVLLNSWLMAFDIPLPWVMRASGPGNILTQYIPYADSYLDQSIMLAASAGMMWHLGRDSASFGACAKLLAFLCLANVLVLMPGRTGYLLAIVVVCLAVLLELPSRLRPAAAVFIPVLLGLTLFYTLPQFQQRVSQATAELTNYKAAPEVHTSVGARLNMWNLSLQAIADRPLAGYGVGNWTPVIKQYYGVEGDALFGEGNGSNPHQELLLWTVELGLTGALLFVGFLYALYLDTKPFRLPIRRAARSMIVLLAVTCMFNSPLYDDLMGDYFCIALGLLLALGLRDNHEKATPHIGSRLTD